ncbi:AAA family ATPase [Mucilaginibacter gotjawali]|uniref:AAA family ATPase n=1 Tax=Mucilaginibacter gotjawali TaxID=1550579 RepID=UPI0021D2BBA3|nr:AAA family ATPase [Mucilaginibacter gotjawali]
MAKTIFIASAEPGSGKSVVTIGLVNMLLCKTQKIGFFKPVINFDPKEKKIHTSKRYLNILNCL